jgi:DNA-binding MarR family transcriptional regulator
MSRGFSKSTPTTIVRLSKIIEILLTDFGLTLNQFRLLSLVDEGATSSAEIAVRLAMKAPNVTAMTNSLIDRGLLVREQDTDDKRRAHLTLTDDSVALMAKSDKRCHEALLHIVKHAGAPPDLLDRLDAWLPVLEATATDLRDGLTEQRKP